LFIQPSNGAAVLYGDGTSTYTPDTDFFGTDSFSYFAKDEELDSEIAGIVSINIDQVIDPVVISDGTLAVPEGSHRFPVNYSDLIYNPDNLFLTFEQLTGPETVTIRNFNTANANFQVTSRTDFFGDDPIQVQVTDSEGNIDDATLTIRITNVPDDPIADSMEFDVPVNQSITFFLDAYDPDNEYGEIVDPVTFGILDTSVLIGTIELLDPSTGEMRYTPDPDFVGDAFFFDYTITSNGANGESITVDNDVQFEVINSRPRILQHFGYLTVNEDGPDTIYNLEDYFVERDVDDYITYVLEPYDDQDIYNVDAYSTDITDNTLTISYNPDENGFAFMVLSAVDKFGKKSIMPLNITINPVNDAPVVANAIDDFPVDEDSDDIEVDLSNVFTDADGDTVSITIENSNITVVESFLNNQTITLSFIENQFGSADITVLATDGNSASATDTFTVTANSVNDVPVATADSVTTDEDNAVSGNVLTNDSDIDGDTLTAVLVADVSNGTIALNTDGSFTYTPSADFNGTDSFTYKANDRTDSSNEVEVSITVNPVNDAPVAGAKSNGLPYQKSHLINTYDAPAKEHIAVDLDRDGDMDALVFVVNSQSIIWLNNDGSGHFIPETIVTDSANFVGSLHEGALHAVDVDGDHDIDIITGNHTSQQIAWFENANMSFSKHVIDSSVLHCNSIHTADLDNDGDLDVLSTSIGDDEVAWYEHVDGSGTFGSKQVISKPVGPRSVNTPDLDGDGDLDVLTASRHQIAWHRNDSGVLTEIVLVSESGILANSISTIDLDQDGDLDILAALRNRRVTWLENTGDTQFIGMISFQVLEFVMSPHLITTMIRISIFYP
jgi:VCBS repeat-containing protein